MRSPDELSRAKARSAGPRCGLRVRRSIEDGIEHRERHSLAMPNYGGALSVDRLGSGD